MRASHATSASRAGTLDDHFGEVYGPTRTKTSAQDGIPQLVLVLSGATTSGKKYKLYQVPGEGEGYKETCFYLIGHGSTFCTKWYCTTTHQGDIVLVPPNALFVAESTTTAFADPFLHQDDLTLELLINWNVKAARLDKWNRLFFLATQANKHGPALAAALEESFCSTS